MGESQETLLTTQREESWHGDLPREGRGSVAAHSPAGGRASRCQQMCPGARALWKKTQAATQGRGGRAELTGTAPGFVPCTWGPTKGGVRVSKQVLVLEISEDTEGSENGHFSKGTLLPPGQGGVGKGGVEDR